MTKILTIDRCSQCPFECHQDSGNWCMHPDAVRDGVILRSSFTGISRFCPLPDAPAWPTVPEADEERDESECIEAPRKPWPRIRLTAVTDEGIVAEELPAVLRGVNPLEEVE